MAIAKTFTKDVILLTRNDSEGVPRGTRRSVPYNSGCIANMVDFQSSWSEERVRGHIENCFKGIIDLENPYPRNNIAENYRGKNIHNFGGFKEPSMKVFSMKFGCVRPTYDTFWHSTSFLHEVATSYRSMKVLSLESYRRHCNNCSSLK